jgi:hypothetical protein
MGFFDRFKNKNNDRAQQMKFFILEFANEIVQKVLPKTGLEGKDYDLLEAIYLGMSIVYFHSKNMEEGKELLTLMPTMLQFFKDMSYKQKQFKEPKDFLISIRNNFNPRLEEYYKLMFLDVPLLSQERSKQGPILFPNVITAFANHFFKEDVGNDEYNLFVIQAGTIFGSYMATFGDKFP